MTFVDANGQRVSTESAYLTPDVLARTNLTIATGAHVSKVIFEHVEGKVPRAVAVRFKDSYGSVCEVTARRQIILSSVTCSSLYKMILNHSTVLERYIPLKYFDTLRRRA